MAPFSRECYAEAEKWPQGSISFSHAKAKKV